ncbi:hypothetical protein [Eisenbergiella sp.]
MKRKIVTTVIIELFFLLGVSLYFGIQDRETVVLGSDDMTLVRVQENGDLIEEESCYYDSSYDAHELYIESPVFILDPGVYRISLSIETNQDGREGDCVSQTKSIHGGYSATDSGRQRVGSENNYTYRVTVLRDREEVVVRSRMNPDGLEPYLLLREIRISYSPFRSILYWGIKLFVVFSLLNLCLLFYVKRNDFEEKTKLLTLALLGIWLLSSAAVFIPYLVRGHDIRFHLMRIEGLKDGLLSGAFPVKIQPTWLNGNGYPVSILYPDLFLYIPACLRILGCSLQTVYKIYIILINGATVGFSYWSFRQMSGRRAWGLLGSFVYTLSMYRLTNVYTRAAVGEYTAMAFMPLILCAMYKIYKEDTESKDFQHNWLLLAFALTGIIQSHIISVEMVGIFIILICIIFWKKTFDTKRLLVLIKSLMGTILLNMWFLVPFLDYYKEDLVVLSAKSGIQMIQDKGVYLPQLFSLVYQPMGSGSQTGMWKEMPMTIGIGGTLVLAACVWDLLIKGRKLDKEVMISLGVTILSIFLTLIYFPYDFIIRNIPFVGKLLSNIQFPFRFLALSALFLAWLTYLMAKEQRWRRLLPVLCVAVGIQAAFFIGDALNETEIFRVKGNADISSFDVSGAEYVPFGTNFDILDRQSKTDEGICVDSCKRNFNNFTLELKNTTAGEAKIQVPLLYYKGYIAKDVNTGLKMTMVKGENNRGEIIVPGGYCGLIMVSFVEPWYWRIAEVITFIFLAGILIVECRRGIIKKREH